MNKLIILLIILMLFPISYSKSIGLGVRPSSINVTLGNETNTSNDFIYQFEINNTGDSKIIIRAIPEITMVNFTEPLTQNLVINPNETKNFFVLFSRDGIEYKEAIGRLRFSAKTEENENLVNTESAVDVKVSLVQLQIIDEVKNREFKNVLLITIAAVLLFLLSAIAVFS